MSESPAEIAKDEPIKIPDVLPVLPLKDIVVFPYIILPLSVGREKSIAAVDQALTEQRMILLTAQKQAQTEEPTSDDVYTVGTVAVIMRMLKLPDNRIRILVQGLSRASIESFVQSEPYFRARIKKIEEAPATAEKGLELEALVRSVKQNLDRAVSLGKAISPEVMVIAGNLDDPARLADLAASNLDLKVDEAQSVLETTKSSDRLRRVNELIVKEINLLTMQQEISTQAKGEMDKSQREYFLRQQLKAIQQELGEGEEISEDIENYRKKVKDKGLPEEAAAEAEKQVKRLERSHPDSAETAIIRTYLDWLTGLPWNLKSEDAVNLSRAQEILDEDHYDLEKIKERILEYLAVHSLKKSMKGPILCFVGPPGVGKTSLGRSIARALGRKFVRISLGGVRDEAEIRGHRRTYVGALPGRIVQGINQAGTSNPVFMLDEIDKMGADYRGDPSSALLEVLDPEQNFSFRDHYLGVPYDLSSVLFITTANTLEPIQPAFLDRMEVLRLSGYTEGEKVKIAFRHLIPKQTEENGVGGGRIEFTEASIRRLVSGYTREAGLRNLEREIGSICRKIAVKIAGNVGKPGADEKKFHIAPQTVESLLGPVKHLPEEQLSKDRVGVATGLAWTAVGGDVLFVEALVMRGKGHLQLTGQLGDVMKESAHAALSFARAHSSQLGVPDEYFETHDIHVHVPAGAIPKDGPSAGITMATAMVSAFTGRPVDRAMAMTGEITLRGEVLPIGGMKEKVLAAKAAHITRLILPKQNRRDLEEIPAPLRKNLEFHFVETVEEVLELALKPAPKKTPPAPKPPAGPETKPAKKKTAKTRVPLHKGPRQKARRRPRG